MGQYLAFGLTTKVNAAKRSARNGIAIKVTLDQLITAMQGRYLFAPNIFDFSETEDYWHWTLKPSVLGQPLVDFLQVFFSDLAVKDAKSIEAALSRLRGLSSEEQLAFAENKELECFQIDEYTENDFVRFEHIDFRPSVCLSYDSIGLHFEGKISLESISQSMAFMTRVLKQRYAAYPVAQALRICITG